MVECNYRRDEIITYLRFNYGFKYFSRRMQATAIARYILNEYSLKELVNELSFVTHNNLVVLELIKIAKEEKVRWSQK